MPRTWSPPPILAKVLPTSALCCVLLLWSTGCESSRTIAPQAGSGPASLRVHPTFTQIKDWTGDGHVDGIEAVVEVLDQFGEPIRGWGTLLFELSDYRRATEQFTGRRVQGPWKGELLTPEQQAERWSPALRAYTFQLGFPSMPVGRAYVLQASFETAGGAKREGGGRLFDKIILEPKGGGDQDVENVDRATGRRR